MEESRPLRYGTPPATTMTDTGRRATVRSTLTPDSTRGAWLRRSVAAAGLILACAVAGRQGIRATSGLTWVAGPDASRDIAAAESIRSGHVLADPLYRDEWLWYNPLAPALAAGVSALTRNPVHVVFARIGAYANLLAPVGLFLLLARGFGSWAALFGVLAFLFLVPRNDVGWVSATYSPWLMPMHFTQGLFYLALAAQIRAWRTRTIAAFGLAGALGGLTLLGHTGPALILGGTIGVLIAVAPGSGPWWRRAGTHLLSLTPFAVAAVIVSAPMLISIVGHYHLTVKNRAPALYVAPEASIQQLPRLVRTWLTLSPVGAIASVGLIWLAATVRRLESRLMLAAIGVNGVLLAYGYLSQAVACTGLTLPVIVPAHHFLYYLSAFEAICFGVGAVALARVPGALARRWNRRMSWVDATAMATCVALVIVAVVNRQAAYAARADFIGERAVALEPRPPDLAAMYDWIVASTRRSDVFLAPARLGQSVIGTSGRKVVAVQAEFSNPFVDWLKRSADQASMETALEDGRGADFLALARVYDVSWVARSQRLASERQLGCCVTPVWASGAWVIYRVNRQP